MTKIKLERMLGALVYAFMAGGAFHYGYHSLAIGVAVFAVIDSVPIWVED